MAHVWGVAAAVLAMALASNAAGADERFVVDRTHSHVQFSIDRFGFGAIIGEFREVEGEVVLDTAAPAKSRVSARIAIASLVSGDATRDGHVTGPAWLNAARFSAMTFRSTSVHLHGDRMATVAGDLTLMGVTRPVSLEVRLNKRGVDPATQREAAGFSATTTLRRSEFGLKTAAGLIGEDVHIRIEALTHKMD